MSSSVPVELIKKHRISVFVLFLINLVPLIGLGSGTWSLFDAATFYWAECFLALSIAFLPYAKHFMVFFLMLVSVGAITKVLGHTQADNIKILMTFWGLYCLCWLLYIEMVKSRYWQIVQKRPPSEQFVMYLTFMGVSIFICSLITISIFDIWHALFQIPFSYYMFFLTTAVIIPTFSMGILNIIDMIGPRHFIHFLIGTYHYPVKRDRIVCFLDMVGSTTMAEKMTPEKSMHLIALFIYDASSIIRKHGGDILNYTGDGLVVLWPRRYANKALTAADELDKWIKTKKDEYKSQFDFIPDFRIGMHAGSVTLGQLGEEKLFIGLYGDVVNTAARIEQLNKELGTKILLSREVTKYMDNHVLVRLKKVGEQPIRGRKSKVQIFTLKNKNDEE